MIRTIWLAVAVVSGAAALAWTLLPFSVPAGTGPPDYEPYELDCGNLIGGGPEQPLDELCRRDFVGRRAWAWASLATAGVAVLGYFSLRRDVTAAEPSRHRPLRGAVTGAGVLAVAYVAHLLARWGTVDASERLNPELPLLLPLGLLGVWGVVLMARRRWPGVAMGAVIGAVLASLGLIGLADLVPTGT